MISVLWGTSCSINVYCTVLLQGLVVLWPVYCNFVCLLFVTAETPFTNHWNRSAQSNTRVMQPVWEHMRPFSTSTISKNTCTRSEETWSTWSSVMLRYGSDCEVSLGAVYKTDPNSADWTLCSLSCMFPQTESCWEGYEVPWGASHAFLLIHCSFCNLHCHPVNLVLLLHHVQVRHYCF